MKRFCLEVRPARGTVGRNACVCAAHWGALGGSARSNSYPPLTYSVNRWDVTGAELGMLLAASHSDAMVGPGAIPLCRQNYSYWRSPEGLHHAAKLEVALRHSVGVVACFTTWDVYGDAAAAAAAAAASFGPDSPPPQPHLHPPAPPGPARGWEQQPQQPQQPQQAWSPQEEECPLTAARHERERQQARAGRSRGTLGSGTGPAASSLSPSSRSGPSFSSYSSSSKPDASAFPFSGPLASLSSSAAAGSSSSSSASPRASASSGSFGSKPPPPPGVPDMDWNWLLPSGGSSGCSSRTSSSDNASDTGAWTQTSPPLASSSSSSSSSSHQQQQHQHQWKWPGVPSSSASHPPRKSLVGFARASGDNSLVATIYDVAVHPAVRGKGIGPRLVKLLVQQVQARSVYDIGVVTPAAAVGFWDRCSFDDDREGSTFMTFMGRPVGRSGLHLPLSSDNVEAADDDSGAVRQLELEGYCRDGGGFGAPRGSQELLEVADLGFWDTARRSESLQALLAAKLQRLRETEAETGRGLWGSGGRLGQAGDGGVRWGAARPRGVAARSFAE